MINANVTVSKKDKVKSLARRFYIQFAKRSILFILLSFSIVFTSCGNEGLKSLNDQEKSDLIFLREEEKLAHDVYFYSFTKYNQNIFFNIYNSEQRHTNIILGLLNKYGIEDPVGNNLEGVFKNSDLQALYDELISKSDSSLSNALEVGATIEDLDIKDIKTFIGHTTNSDLLDAYNKLICGSQNHLRSFVGQLGTYTPSFISQTEYDAIINSAKQHCGN